MSFVQKSLFSLFHSFIHSRDSLLCLMILLLLLLFHSLSDQKEEEDEDDVTINTPKYTDKHII